MSKNKAVRIAVDFDGTIVTDAFPKIGAINPSMLSIMRQMKELGGIHIIIWSCRANPVLNKESGRKYYEEMVDFIKAHNIPHHEIDDGSQGKIQADLYIDDKAMSATASMSAITKAVNSLLISK